MLKENDQTPILFDSLLGLYEKELLQEGIIPTDRNPLYVEEMT